MIIFAKAMTLLGWMAIIFNWLSPIPGYFYILHWTGLGLAAAHFIEMLVFLPKAKKAKGHFIGHLIQLFIFGYAHNMQLDKSLKEEA